MSPEVALARLQQISDEREKLEAEQRELLAALVGVPTPREMPQENDRVISSDRALAISGRSHSSLYRDARQHGFGWKLPTGSWAFNERETRAFYSRKK